MTRINQATVDLVKKWEGFKADAYLDPVGIWTIGYGTTAAAGLGIAPHAGMKITEAEAERLLLRGLEKFAAEIRPAITAPVNENEFGAFVSLAYNIGPGAFKRSSALRHFNAGDKPRAAQAMKAWNKARVNGVLQVMRGLTNRREEEVRLFLTPVEPATPAPPPVPMTFWQALAAWLRHIFGGRT